MIEFEIKFKKYRLDEKNIEAIYLFGSSARGDCDYLSDTDLFILINDCSEEDFINKKIQLAISLQVPANWISLYKKSTVEEMHDYGSYFLWHIKTEGLLLYSRSRYFEKLLETLPKYIKVEEDLNDYLTIYKDVKSAFSKDPSTAYYELAVMASLIRNTCIALSYLHGKLVFGRVQPVLMAQELVGSDFMFDIAEYKELYNYRIAYSRNVKDIVLPEPTSDMIEKWIKRCETIIHFALNYKRKE